jgi:hypothetical protein
VVDVKVARGQVDASTITVRVAEIFVAPPPPVVRIVSDHVTTSPPAGVDSAGGDEAKKQPRSSSTRRLNTTAAVANGVWSKVVPLTEAEMVSFTIKLLWFGSDGHIDMSDTHICHPMFVADSIVMSDEISTEVRTAPCDSVVRDTVISSCGK